MRTFGVNALVGNRMALGLVLTLAVALPPCSAADKPTGAPLQLSNVETEQGVPLSYLDPDGKTAHCATVKLHWNPLQDVGPKDDATSFELDIAADSPGAAIFTAQLWKASLASALVWQEPWQGARWKVLQTPTTDGTGINAALAVGMVSTSARRPYPPKTVVIGGLNPDGSLGAVSHIADRLKAAADAGMTKVVIPSVQRFDTDATGQVINIARMAGDLHLECVPVDNLVQATEAVMNDPLPDQVTGPVSPKYSNDVASYIDDYARREQNETTFNLKFAPKEETLSKYPPHLASIWHSVYADVATGTQSYAAGQVYVAYRLFSRANASMQGVNALTGQNRANFDVKSALAESDDLRNRLHGIMSPPSIDKGELQSAVLVAEMADWAYEINAELEGAQLVTKQTFSQRTDATDAEKDRARESILFAIEKTKYLLGHADFFDGLLTRIGKDNAIPVDENAAHLLPQLIPAQLATARIFTDGIRQRASELRDGLLFDPELVAYVSVLKETKTDWDARQRKKEVEAQDAANNPDPAAQKPDDGKGTDNKGADDKGKGDKTDGKDGKKDDKTVDVQNAVKLNSNSGQSAPMFDPGTTFVPPHTELAPTTQVKKTSEVAQCLIWVNNDCEIAMLDEKYLRLNGTIDPATKEWHVTDRAKLDALLQSAESGAREGIGFAEKAEVDSSVLSMIYERGAHLRIQSDDASALEALRQYWRCALLGSMCWQLAHAHKAQPIDLGTQEQAGPPAPVAAKTDKAGDKSQPDKSKPGDSTTSDKNAPPKPAPVVTPAPSPAASTNSVIAVTPPTPAAPIDDTPPPVSRRALPVTDDSLTNAPSVVAPPTPAPAPAPSLPPTPALAPVVTPPAPLAPSPAAAAVNAVVGVPDDANIPVAPIAKVQDYNVTVTPPSTNAAPSAPVAPRAQPVDNADSHAFP
jgi:hypothetical protein